MNRPRLLTLVLLLTCVACVKAPPLLTPEIGIDVPQNWTAAETDDTPPHSNWWMTLGDPQLAALI